MLLRVVVSTMHEPDHGPTLDYELDVPGRCKAFPGLNLTPHDEVSITSLLEIRTIKGMIYVVISKPDDIEESLPVVAGVEMEYPEQVPGMPFFNLATGQRGYIEGMESIAQIDVDDCHDSGATHEGTLRALRRMLGQGFVDVVQQLERMAMANPGTYYDAEVELTPDQIITFVKIVNRCVHDRNAQDVIGEDGDHEM
jgi:hypothetical protein